jgi:hypothetical protein
MCSRSVSRLLQVLLLILIVNSTGIVFLSSETWAQANKAPTSTSWQHYPVYPADEDNPLIDAPTRNNNQGSPYEGPPGFNPDRKKQPPKQVKTGKWWQFWKPAEVIRPPDEEMVVEVGPREFSSSPEPVLRLPVALRNLEGQAVLPGMYLVETLARGLPAAKNPNDPPPLRSTPEWRDIAEAKPTAIRWVAPYPKEITLHLKRSGATYYSARLYQLPPALTPKEPVEALPEDENPHSEAINQGPHRSIQAQLSTDAEQLRFHYQVGSTHYESDWLATGKKYSLQQVEQEDHAWEIPSADFSKPAPYGY